MATFDYKKYQEVIARASRRKELLPPSVLALKDYINNPDKYVFPFVIKERNKERTIITYNKGKDYGNKLRQAHETILNNFQANFSQRNEHSYAYHKGVRCVDALDDHLSSNHFIKLDIHHFFESITESSFFKVYDEFFNDNWKEQLKGCFYKGSLSIGFVTSPELSDFYMRSFDRAVEQYLLEHEELHYSRYSDDMLLSSEASDTESLEALFNYVKDELSKLDLEINEKKTRRVTLSYETHNSISFLGLNLSKENEEDNKVTISKRYILFLLKLIEKNKKFKSSCRELINEINSRVAYLAYNSPVSYERFQKKHRNIYGVSYNFIPKKPFERTAPLNASNIPNFEEDSKLFKIDLHKNVKGKEKKGFGVNDAIELTSYIGKDQKVVTIPPYINSIASNAFSHHIEIEEIVLNDKLKNIDASAFIGCSGLKKINLPQSVKFIGQSAFSGCKSLKEIVIPDKLNTIHGFVFDGSGLERVVFGKKVREISQFAFSGCLSLKELVFDEALTTIGSSAFQGCLSLKTIDLTNTKVEKIDSSALSRCHSLTTVRLPNTLLSLEESVFSGCPNLEEIYIPELLVNFSSGVFRGCHNLRRIEIDKNNRVYHHSKNFDAIIETNTAKLVFALPTYMIDEDIQVVGKVAYAGSYLKEIKLPKNLSAIEPGAFTNCRWLKKIEIPESVREIGASAFMGCTSLKEAKLPANLKVIPSALFKDCINLEHIELSDNVEEIGGEAFADCHSLTINEFKSVKSIGFKAFKDCHNIKHLVIPQVMNKINENAFYGMAKSLESISVHPLNTVYTSNEHNVLIERKDGNLILGCKNSVLDKDVILISSYAFAYCEELKEINLPYTVKEIGKGAFNNCIALEKVNFNKVYKVHDQAFMNCSSLREINLPDTVVHIGRNAFSNTGIKEVNIPSSVSALCNECFSGCEDLEKIYLPSTLKQFDRNMFKDCPNIKVIEVDPKNTIYDSRNNCNAVIFKYNNTLLLGCQNTVIPDDVKRIGNGAFSNINGLKSISIRLNIENMGDGVFENCHDLEEVKYLSCASLGDNMFKDCGKLKTIDFYTKLDIEIGGSAFRNCKNLENLVLPPNLKGRIREYTFAYCEKLKNIVIPSRVTEIATGAFLGCKELESVTLNKKLESIYSSAFRNCEKLTKIDLPESLTKISGANVFYGTGIKEIHLPKNVFSLGSMIFRGMDLEKITIDPDNKFYKVEGNTITYNSLGNKHLLLALKKFTIPNDIVHIDPFAFYENKELTTLTLPDSLCVINNSAFQSCSNLLEVNFPKHLVRIGDYAFGGCESLEEVNIEKENADEAKVLFIGENAFAYCHHIKSISIKGQSINLHQLAFNDYSRLEKVDIQSRLYETSKNKDNVLCDGRLVFATPDSTIPAGTRELGPKLYSDHKYDKVVVPEGVTYINDCFNDVEIKEITLPSSLRNIDNSFSHAKITKFVVSKDNPSFRTNKDGNMLYEVASGKLLYAGDDGRIPEGTTSLSLQALNRDGIKHIYIPASLLEIGSLREACGNAESIECDPDHPLFYAMNNCLLKKSDNSLVLGCPNSIIPVETTKIHMFAFGCVKEMDTLNIPMGVRYISKSAFPKNNNYKNIVVEKGNPVFDSRDNCNAIILSKDNVPVLTCPNSKLPPEVEVFVYDERLNTPLRPFLATPEVIDSNASIPGDDLPF